MSGGFAVWTTSKRRSALRRCTRRAMCQRAAPYSRAYPAGPPSAGRSGYRSISIPSRRTYGSRSCLTPRGQITLTSKPASRRAVASCQTRRSSGTDRFSTSKRTLPGDADIFLAHAAFCSIRKSNKVDDHAPVRGRNCFEDFWGRRANNADVRVAHRVLGRLDEERGEVRYMTIDVLAIRAHEPRHRDLGVVDLEGATLAE